MLIKYSGALCSQKLAKQKQPRAARSAKVRSFQNLCCSAADASSLNSNPNGWHSPSAAAVVWELAARSSIGSSSSSSNQSLDSCVRAPTNTTIFPSHSYMLRVRRSYLERHLSGDWHCTTTMLFPGLRAPGTHHIRPHDVHH